MPGFSGQGIVEIAPRLVSGLPGVFRDIGNSSVFEIALTSDIVERAESRTGFRLPNRRLTKSQGGTLHIVGDEFNRPNFAQNVLGTATDVAAAAPVAGYVLPDQLKVGDIVSVPAKNIGTVTVKDSTGSPKTLVKDTNYSIDPLSGEIKILDITTGGAFTQPFKVDYTPGAVSVVGAFKLASAEYYVRLKVVNTDDNNKPGVCDVFRVRFDPTKALALINNDYLDWDLNGTILADLNRLSTSPEGQFFSYTEAGS